ncbi:hypothetical protein BD413DRAFT_487888 [Trametes elegans]|nr:hypothetical protein BD413DRAFT_487888 [Trametes elegans]
MLMSLPVELIMAIVRGLEGDVEGLRTVALTCRDLLPIAREELFAVINVRAVEEGYMQVHLQHVVEVRTGRAVSPTAEEHRLLSGLPLRTLPKLRALGFVCLSPIFYIRLTPGLFSALGQLTSVTTLTLSRPSFLHLWHAQSVICALPNLSRLGLREPVFESFSLPLTYDGPLSRRFAATATRRPQLAFLSLAPAEDGAGEEIAAWVGQGPSGRTLATLVVPYHAVRPHVVLREFGPSVVRLSMPLRAPDGVYDRYLAEYSGLETLTVVLEAYSASAGPWHLLGPLMEHGVCAEALRVLRVDVRVEYGMDLCGALDWAALDRVNDALDEARYAGVGRVEVVVQWREGLGWDPEDGVRETVVENVRARLYGPAQAGKLLARVHKVKEVSVCVQRRSRVLTRRDSTRTRFPYDELWA